MCWGEREGEVLLNTLDLFFFFLLSTSLELKQDIVAALSGNVLLDFYKFFESQKDGYAWHYQGNIIILFFFFFAILSYSKIE